MPWTDADVEILKQAILDRKGAKSIQFNDQIVTFDSIKDMLDLLQVMQADIAVGSRTRYAATSKGI
jgi:hypothetical protein